MIRQYIVSSNIDVVGWHRGTLYIKFINGGAYAYDKVDMKTYLDLVKAESVGQHFHKHIKGKFAYTKLDTDPFQTNLKKAA